jgi:hypothetical protein
LPHNRAYFCQVTDAALAKGVFTPGWGLTGALLHFCSHQKMVATLSQLRHQLVLLSPKLNALRRQCLQFSSMQPSATAAGPAVVLRQTASWGPLRHRAAAASCHGLINVCRRSLESISGLQSSCWAGSSTIDGVLHTLSSCWPPLAAYLQQVQQILHRG